MRSQLNYPGKQCANSCGYADKSGNEYALVGVESGMSIVNITKPDSIFEIVALPWPAGIRQLWKEIKVYKNYAYMVSEAGSGVQIVDLSKLPNANVLFKYWKPAINSDLLNSVHALHIDTTKGNIYLYGSNVGNKGAVCASLADPWNPEYLGKYDLKYVHDGYVDNDTLYAAEIYDGTCSIVDFSNKSNPVVISSFNTPLNFTHNTWLGKDKRYLFTTDEKSNSSLTSYDINDLSNVKELDAIKSNPGSNSIVHNTHITVDTFAVTSWYRDGVTIVDVKRPHNLIQVGNYDTYPENSGDGFNGAWGVYPFLPSKNIIVSNIENGLYVLTPTYKRACWLEGTIRDSVTNAVIKNVTISITENTKMNTLTNLSGEFATGTVNSGTYTVKLSKLNYQDLIIENIKLTNNVLTILNRKLMPTNIGLHENNKDVVFNFCGNNPFQDEVCIKINRQNLINNTITIYDVCGKSIASYEISAKDDELMIGKNLPPGIYFLKELGNSALKLIKY